MEQLIIPFLLSLSVGLFVTPIIAYLATKYKFIDDPKKHKHPAIIHKKTVPRAGGVAIFIAIVSTMFLFLPFDRTYAVIALAGAIVVGIGLLDDKYDISPYIRFSANILCALLVVVVGINIPFVTNPLGGIINFSTLQIPFIAPFIQYLPMVFAVLWIVWIMNILNWSKGVDGQMPGVAVIAAVVIGIAALRFPVLNETNVHASQLSFIVAGAALGFLFYNAHPARIFPGYSATILGFLIGILSILSGVKLATAILVMGIPTVDAAVTIFRRLMNKKSPFWHDKGHLHHLFLDMGLSQKKIAYIYWTVSFLLGLFALTLSSKGKLFAIILVIVSVIAVIVTLRFAIKITNKERV